MLLQNPTKKSITLSIKNLIPLRIDYELGFIPLAVRNSQGEIGIRLGDGP
jgi:hypothetical protein